MAAKSAMFFIVGFFVFVTFLLCVSILTIILYFIMPQISHAAKEGCLISKALKDLNISEGNLISAAIFLHELGEIKKDVTALRKNITANGKAILSKLQKPLKEMRDELEGMRENMTITEDLSDILSAKISKPISEMKEHIETLNKDLSEAQRKHVASLANIKKEMKEIKQKLISRATLTESCFFSCVNVISFLLISIVFA
ncbi:uncharacterized protein LOC122960800 [Acropora millepora]|uniref:uncharacterized protein LOC114961162 n=1 Tax=Acropora millepora TaxID=45264 RepID=UPI001CF28B93|nr:uncharacterized protein LOC114961162 [Acropora millepora]XP_044179232.1 uncharacterized protein LOC122960800 [Acropora millepora]